MNMKYVEARCETKRSNVRRTQDKTVLSGFPMCQIGMSNLGIHAYPSTWPLGIDRIKIAVVIKGQGIQSCKYDYNDFYAEINLVSIECIKELKFKTPISRILSFIILRISISHATYLDEYVLKFLFSENSGNVITEV